MSISFQVVKTCPKTGARVGRLVTPHGVVSTPSFVPVGSQGTVKTLAPEEVRALGVEMVLGNTYHLYLRPGVEVIEGLGGLHHFMAWEGPLLTDSGGFQVFSLVHLSRVNDGGVLFRSHLDGSEHFLTPELAIELQERMGADIIMTLDQCPPYSPDYPLQKEAADRTHCWALRCQRAHRRGQALFGIVQGGTFADLRRESARFMASLGLPGYALGGLSLGEPKEVMHAMLEEAVPHLPPDRPRYLMGVGSPEDLLEAVSRGLDLFDSALPTRLGRNGSLFTRRGRCNLRNTCFKRWSDPLEPGCDCYACRTFSVAYLHHLFKAEELLVYRMATIHNLRFLTRLMDEVRRSILEGSFPQFKDSFLSAYEPTDEGVRREQKQRWLQSRRQRHPNLERG